MAALANRAHRGIAPALQRRLLGALLPLLLLAAWEWASRGGDQSAYVFVPLGQVWRTLLELVGNGELLSNTRVSLHRTCVGLSMGAGLGIAVGTLMAGSRIADRLIGPLYHGIRQVPILGLVPLLGLWFGNGDTSKILMVVLGAFYPTVLGTCEGLCQSEKRYLEVGRLLTLTRAQTFRHVLLPSALPAIFTGLSQALAFAWLSSMGAELLFTAGPGLGGLLLVGEAGGRMDIVMICVLTIALIGFAMNAAFDLLRRVLVAWQPRGAAA